MTPETRRSAIVALVTERGELSIDALSHHFGVSLQTVRSDLRDLTAQGLLLRRHGMVASFARENIGYLAAGDRQYQRQALDWRTGCATAARRAELLSGHRHHRRNGGARPAGKHVPVGVYQ